MAKKIGTIFGVFGGLAGFILSVLFVIGRIDKVAGVSPALAITATMAIISSVIGLVGSMASRREPKKGGIMMIVGAVGGLASIHFSYLIPAALFLLGGLLLLVGKKGNAEKGADLKDQNVKKPKNQAVYAVSGILAGLYICTIVAIMAIDTKVVWLPWDVVSTIKSDIQFYQSHPAKTLPDYAELNTDLPVKGFVEDRFVRALSLINREPDLKYLVDLVIKNKIPIMMGKAEDFQGWTNPAVYKSVCPKGGVGSVLVNPSSNWPEFALAGTLVHELTHAYNKITKPSHYCDGNHYLSNELAAYKNEKKFMYQYNHLYFMDKDGIGKIDLRGNSWNYCLYFWIKNSKIYSDNIDDLNLMPGPNEELMCRILLLQ